MKPQTQMLHDCLTLVGRDKLNADLAAAAVPEMIYFTQLLDWIAVHLSYEVQVVSPAFQMETHEALRTTFDLGLLKQDVWDWFGELAVEVGIGDQVPGTELTRADSNVWANAFSEGAAPRISKDIQNNPVFDPDGGTGRLLLSHLKWKDEIIIYSVEKHKISYRVSLLNAFIYGFNSFIIHADPDVHDLEIGSQNWLSSNQWNPIAFNELLAR